MDLFHDDFIKHTDYQSESAVVFDVHGRDLPTQHIVATYPTEVFSGDRADEEGEILNILECYRI
jgi:hypothetical protein